MYKFAFSPDSDFTYNRLLDTTNKSPTSAYNWIIPAEKLGVREAQLYDLCSNAINLEIYSQYSNPLLNGISTKVLNPELPLGVRYFAPAAGNDTKKCRTSDGSIVDQYYVVDGLSTSTIDSKDKDSKPVTLKGNGIVFSAAGIVNAIDDSSIEKFYNPGSDDYSICKKIKITTDAKGGTDTNYVNKIDAEKLISSGIAKEAFFTLGGDDSQPPPAMGRKFGSIVYGYDWGALSRLQGERDGLPWTKPSVISSHTNIGDYIIGEDMSNYHMSPEISSSDILRLGSDAPHLRPLAKSNPDLRNFPVDNQKLVPGIQVVPGIQNIEQLEDEFKKRQIRPSPGPGKGAFDPVMGIFLGSITVLGLFIVFQLGFKGIARR